MATVLMNAGPCGFKIKVTATSADGQNVDLRISSGCPEVQALAKELTQVDAFGELKRLCDTQVAKACQKHIPHAACPVSVGVLKAIEVAAGLALPTDVTIEVRKE